MASDVLSRRADADVQAIAEETVRRWGLARAERYVRELQEAFERLVMFPELGRDVGHLRAGMMGMASGSHLVFYRRRPEGVLIVRVLHERMDFERHVL